MEAFSGYPVHESHNSISSQPMNKDSPQEQIRTVKITNLSLGASVRNVLEFFSSSSDIEYVEMRCDNEQSQIAFVTFRDSHEAKSAVLLSGKPIVDLTVTITLAPDHQLPLAASLPPIETKKKAPGGAESTFQKAGEVFNNILSKGYIFGKDAVNKAKSLDEKHQLTSTVSAKVRDFQVSEKVKSAYAATEPTVNNARSAIMRNEYVVKGTLWVTEAFSKVAKAAGEVGQHTKEKLGMAKEESERVITVEDSARVPLPVSPKASDGSGPGPSKPMVDESAPLQLSVSPKASAGSGHSPTKSSPEKKSDQGRGNWPSCQ